MQIKPCCLRMLPHLDRRMICCGSVFILHIHVKLAKEHTLCRAFLPSCYRAEHIRALCSGCVLTAKQTTPGLDWNRAQTNSSGQPQLGWFVVHESATLVFTLVRTDTSRRGKRPLYPLYGSRCGSTQN